jgi:molybdopterin-guanine dinucleotide biosynthesis protein MobB
MKSVLPAVGICGWSGSGKTTLVVELVRRFTARGLRVGVIKHDVHGLSQAGGDKDSDRIFQAGADAVVVGPGEVMQRMHPGPDRSLPELIAELDARCDLVLCEGFKHERFAVKVWLRSGPSQHPPEGVEFVNRILGPEEDRSAIVEAMIEEWLKARVAATPIYGGVLIGGASRRMGRPKHLIELDGRSWVERVVRVLGGRVQSLALLGAGEIPADLDMLPMLPDVPGRQGPLAGMLAAMRWQPEAAWLFVACDQPLISVVALDWVLGLRRPGVLAILPRRFGCGAVEPLLALYEPRARRLLERVSAPAELVGMPGVVTPEIPEGLKSSWEDADTPEEAERNFGASGSMLGGGSA